MYFLIFSRCYVISPCTFCFTSVFCWQSMTSQLCTVQKINLYHFWVYIVLYYFIFSSNILKLNHRVEKEWTNYNILSRNNIDKVKYNNNTPHPLLFNSHPPPPLALFTCTDNVLSTGNICTAISSPPHSYNSWWWVLTEYVMCLFYSFVRNKEAYSKMVKLVK